MTLVQIPLPSFTSDKLLVLSFSIFNNGENNMLDLCIIGAKRLFFCWKKERDCFR